MRAAALGVSCACACACGRIDFDPRAGNDWWDLAWPYREVIVIDHTKVAGDLADFPVLISIHDSALTAHAAGHYAFVDAGGAPLAFELEPVPADPASLLAWVKLPALSSSTDTTLYLYDGDQAASDQAQPAAVWSNGFAGVYHFGDGTTLDLLDATGGNDASTNGAVATAGKINGAAHLDGVSNVIAPSNGVDTTPGAVNTVTFWLYFQPPFGQGVIAFSDVADSVVYDLWFEADGCEGFNTGQGDVLGTTTSSLDGRWVHVAAMFYNGVPTYAPAQPAHSNALYFDGVPQVLSFTCAGGGGVGATAYQLIKWGSNVFGGTNYRMMGNVDEGRFAAGVRSAAWIQTEVANQGDPAAFVSVGAEQAR